MAGPLDRANAPYGPIAPATDCTVVAAPSSDVELSPAGRGFFVLGAGTVSVTTAAGNDKTFSAPVGPQPLAITHILAATDVDIMVYHD